MGPILDGFLNGRIHFLSCLWALDWISIWKQRFTSSLSIFADSFPSYASFLPTWMLHCIDDVYCCLTSVGWIAGHKAGQVKLWSMGDGTTLNISLSLSLSLSLSKNCIGYSYKCFEWKRPHRIFRMMLYIVILKGWPQLPQFLKLGSNYFMKYFFFIK